jgi:hypothetical protein
MTSARAAAESLVADLQSIFGKRLRSFAIYGAHAEKQSDGEPSACLGWV